MRGTKAKLIRSSVYTSSKFRDRTYREGNIRNFKTEVHGGEEKVKGLLERGFNVVKELVNGVYKDIVYYSHSTIIADDLRQQYQAVKRAFKGTTWRLKKEFR